MASVTASPIPPQVARLIATVRATPNRGDVHIFLGDPLADLCDTTTVEPGNAYSPGLWTCGIALWLLVGDQAVTPAHLPPEAITWGFGREVGTPPTVTARWSCEGITVRHELCHIGAEGAVGVDFNRIHLTAGPDATTGASATLVIAVTGRGPAGSIMRRLDWDAERRQLRINGATMLTVETPGIACHIVRAGVDEAGPDASRLALLWTDVVVADAKAPALAFKTEHDFSDRLFTQALPIHEVSPRELPPEEAATAAVFRAYSVAEGFAAAEAAWAEALPARIFAPDERVAQVWEASAYHILAAMELGLPRIGVVNYPIFWIRDGIIVLRALDLFGRSDLARLGQDYLAPLIFSGGFGAEADAPGEGIWSLVQHARMTQDVDWLAGVFPAIRRRVGWLRRMCEATQPLRAVTENRMPRALYTPGGTVVCLEAEDGLIHGRMDWHTPDLYINAWAVAGFREAAWAAYRLEYDDEGAAWEGEADLLEAAMAEIVLPDYGNDRDPAVTPYPTGALAGPAYREDLQKQFATWYRAFRLDDAGKRQREPLWTYFEAAQAHNALLLGLKAEAWVTLDGLLADATVSWRVAAWVEGAPGGAETLPYGNGPDGHGWLYPERAHGGNMPHNWTSAEMVAALRTIFVLEEGGRLLLGTGVPKGWVTPGARFGVEDMPTMLGPCSYTVEIDAEGRQHLSYDGPASYTCCWPGADDAIPVEISGGES